MGNAAESFEDLHIYQRARELANAIYKITKSDSFSRDFGLVDQIRRAAVSILSNIAEGFERGSKTEFIQDQSYLKHDEYQRLYEICKQINGMISNFIAHLQKTDYQGEKINRPKRLALQKDKQRMDKFFASHGIRLPDYNQQEVQ